MAEGAEKMQLLTPLADGPLRELACFDPAHEVLIEQQEGCYTIHDPLSIKPYRVGDMSYFSDQAVDGAAHALLRQFGFLAGIHQLHNPETLSVIAANGRWSVLQHTLGAMALAEKFGVNPEHVVYNAWHDLTKIQGGHDEERLLGRHLASMAAQSGNGSNTVITHDDERNEFAQRAGLLTILEEVGVIEHDGTIIGTNSKIHSVLGKQVVQSMIHRKNGYLEPERVQYSVHEGLISGKITQEQAWDIINSIYRVNGEIPGHGYDHLVFSKEDPAMLLTRTYNEIYTQHWGDPVDSIGSELSVLQKQIVLLSSGSGLENFTTYYPGDVLRTHYNNLDRSARFNEDDLARKAYIVLQSIRGALVQQQREAHLGVDTVIDGVYDPTPPDWIKMRPVRHELPFEKNPFPMRLEGYKLVIAIHENKIRKINPLVGAHGKFVRILDKYPIEGQQLDKYALGAARQYLAEIDLRHESLGLSTDEIDVLRRSIDKVRQEWHQALRRSPMPDDVLRAYIQEGNETWQIEGARAYDILLANRS